MKTPISRDELLALHARSLREHGGASGVKDEPSRCIDAALNACLYRNNDQYDPFIFASSLFFCLARGHNFVDGNKRVSWAALCVVLLQEGLLIRADDDEVEAFVLGVASGKSTHDDVEEWLLARLHSVERG